MAREIIDFEAVGLDVALICRILLRNDYDFYLGVPASFMQAIYDGLRDLSIADERIHAKSVWTIGPDKTSTARSRHCAPALAVRHARPGLVRCIRKRGQMDPGEWRTA
jgi:hypothetical protein